MAYAFCDMDEPFLKSDPLHHAKAFRALVEAKQREASEGRPEPAKRASVFQAAQQLVGGNLPSPPPQKVDKEEWIRLLAERAAAKRVGLLPETVGPLEPEREELVERVRESFEQTQPDPGSGKTTIIHVRLPAEQKQTLETAAKAA